MKCNVLWAMIMLHASNVLLSVLNEVSSGQHKIEMSDIALILDGYLVFLIINKVQTSICSLCDHVYVSIIECHVCS